MTLFDLADNQTIVARIQSLEPNTPNQWGKMNVAQMLAHCVQPMKIAFREVQSKRGLIGYLFGGMAKRKYITGANDFDKNLPTHPTFVQTGTPDFFAQTELLISYVQRWITEGSAAITTDEHPFFGKMSAEEWDILMLKHLDHHLRQFGA